MSYTLRDVYKEYSKECKNPIDSLTFRDICSDFNIGIMDYILEGKEFNMGSNLSTISITRHDRDPRNPRIDWGESNKYRKELLAEGKRFIILAQVKVSNGLFIILMHFTVNSIGKKVNVK